ncbi:GNAT family N-acetyltransferase [Marinomonas rhizomae]|uniref:Acetyltransferase (GNAT) family protein n=1 Tax=Marinomonas rhizomae TaxID=491948 RepID=A0A366IYY5_9GAMM|nr:GNAT family N-acetyltransferase [Marinomonas rhizomae]RBP80011.1 acetyltransferase (GNAT) family protein [Marinomonas rhizomae]RNF71940.1 GNAT family N-acetyltransferase [Marinomonas rhizomae]
MVIIEKMTTQHLADVINLGVVEEQRKFVGTIDEILKSANAQVRPHVIFAEDQIVGFFLIDITYSKNYDFAKQSNSIGLRSFFISKEYQGGGYAKQAILILPNYLSEAYPNHTEIFLTVNCQNSIAKALYLKGGFKDTNSLYYGGSAGPQHIMVRAISSSIETGS